MCVCVHMRCVWWLIIIMFTSGSAVFRRNVRVHNVRFVYGYYGERARKCRFAVYPLRCSLGLLGFALRDSAGAAPKAGAARTRGGTLAGGATRIRGASGSERSRAAMSAPASLPKEIHLSAKRGELQKVVKWLRKGGGVDALCPTKTEDVRATAEPLLHAASEGG